MSDEYFTVKEIADKFKVSKQSVYDWITAGSLRAVKLGTRTRIPASALEEFVKVVAPGESLEDD